MPESTGPTSDAPTKIDDDQVVSWQDLSLRHGPSHARMWIIAVVGLTLDLWSKHWAFSQLQDVKVVIPELLHFRRSLNPGALFGLGHGLTTVFIAASILALLFVLYLFAHTPRERKSMHVALGLILAGALGNLYDRAFVRADAVWRPADIGWRSWTGSQVYRTGKLVRETERYWFFAEWPEGDGPQFPIKKLDKWRVEPTPVVRDFIKIETGWLPKGIQLWKWIFNVADGLLVCGVAILLLNFWWDRRLERAAARAQDTSERDS
ncbi:MAG: signal peptidase II [Phycisphaerae bacterium]|nr:signal peptidase II [Phycisphaerae bacterium]